MTGIPLRRRSQQLLPVDDQGRASTPKYKIAVAHQVATGELLRCRFWGGSESNPQHARAARKGCHAEGTEGTVEAGRRQRVRRPGSAGSQPGRAPRSTSRPPAARKRTQRGRDATGRDGAAPGGVGSAVEVGDGAREGRRPCSVGECVMINLKVIMPGAAARSRREDERGPLARRRAAVKVNGRGGDWPPPPRNSARPASSRPPARRGTSTHAGAVRDDLDCLPGIRRPGSSVCGSVESFVRANAPHRGRAFNSVR